MGTKNNPGPFNCYAKAEPDEPMFILLGRDALGGAMVELWADLRVELFGDDPNGEQILEARKSAKEMKVRACARGKGKHVAIAQLEITELRLALQRRSKDGA